MREEQQALEGELMRALRLLDVSINHQVRRAAAAQQPLPWRRAGSQRLSHLLPAAAPRTGDGLAAQGRRQDGAGGLLQGQKGELVAALHDTADSRVLLVCMQPCRHHARMLCTRRRLTG